MFQDAYSNHDVSHIRYDGVMKFYSRSIYPPFMRQTWNLFIVLSVSIKQLDVQLNATKTNAISCVNVTVFSSR